MYSRRLCFILLISVLSYQAWAQYESKEFHHYSSNDGLSNRYITGLVQDQSGYIWIATHRGLNRFDGNRFKQFLRDKKHNPLPDNTIFSSHLIPDNELAISTNDGAQVIDLKTLKAKNLEFATEDALRYWSYSIQYIQKDADGNYGVSTKTGFYIFSPSGQLKKRFDYYKVKDIGHSWMLFGRQIHLLPNGNMFQENSSGLLEYDRKKNTIGKISTEYAGLKNLIPYLVKTRARFFPIGTFKILLCKPEKNSLEIFDIRNGEKYACHAPFNVRDEIGWQTKLTRLDDTSWALTSSKKGFYIVRIDSSRRIVTCDFKKYFEDYFCSIVYRDREGRHWIGTNDGLFKEKLHKKIVYSFTAGQESHLDNWYIRSLYVTNKKIFAGTDKEELFIIDKQTRLITHKLRLSSPEDLTRGCNSILRVHPDTLWIATESGLKWVHIKNHTWGKVQLPNNSCKNNAVRQMFSDQRNNIWLASSNINCVMHYNRVTRQFSVLTDQQFPLFKVNLVNNFAEDRAGNVWMGGDAIVRWNSQRNLIDTLIEHLPTQKKRKKGFGVMRDLNGDIWVSIHDDGVARLTGENSPLHVRNENIIEDNLSRIEPGIIQGYLFMVTNQNIGVLDTRNLRSTVFNHDDGIPQHFITSRNFIYDSSDRSTWFACNNIICRISNLDRWENTNPPTLNITEISVINDSLINNPSSVINLKRWQNDIRISLSAVNFTDPTNMRFAYRIKNQKDTAWVETGFQQEILLTNLSPGKYEVETRVKAFDNKWPDQVKGLQILIEPPFWKTIWFWIVVGVAVVLSVYLLYRWRIARVRKAASERLQVQQLKTEEYKYRLELEQISNYFSSSLAGKNSLDEVLWDVAKNLFGHMGYVDCMIYLWNKDKTKMIQKAGFGPKGSPEALESQIFDVVPGQGVVGYVMQSKEPVLISDTRKDERYRMDEMFRLSEICVPIIHNNELLGIIDSEHHALNYFKDRDLKILTTIATLVGEKIKQMESEKSLEIKQQELATINGQLAETQLAALQTQMNPHFIFNALNSIKRMILDNEKQNASRYLSKFAHMIRLTLNQSKETFITMQENIEYLHAYLEMEQLRFDDSFAYNIETSNNLDEEETRIPSLMIQPLVENAIWHGLMHKEGEKKIMITFHQNHDKITCTIEDNGIGINESQKLKSINKKPHRSVGLDNLRNRVKIMNEKYDMNCTLEIVDLSETGNHQKGTRAVLKFKIMNN